MMSEAVDKDQSALEIERIKLRISQLIETHFQRGEAILYLSRLGALLGTDRVIIEKLTGARLATFVRENFDYEVGAEGQHGNVLFLRSKNTTLLAADPSVRQLAPRPPRYVPKFWAAFAVPPTNTSAKRFINIDTLNFGADRNALGDESSDIREIDTRFIAPLGASGSAAETAERIVEWLGEQKLDPERFVFKQKPKATDSSTILSILLTALDGEQLKRVTLPLDVVKSLHERTL